METAAVFDIDGTLLRGFIIESFPRHLANHGLIEERHSRSIDHIVAEYRQGGVSYRYTADNIPRIYAEAIAGREVKAVEEAAEAFMEDHIPRSIYGYTPELIRIARRRFGKVIALSGSPEEPIRRLLSQGFDAAYGSVFESRGGVFTGRVTSNLIAGEEKVTKLREVAAVLELDLSRSAAFGDSDQDAPTLESVGIPVPVNPNRELRLLAVERGWRWLSEADLPASAMWLLRDP